MGRRARLAKSGNHVPLAEVGAESIPAAPPDPFAEIATLTRVQALETLAEAEPDDAFGLIGWVFDVLDELHAANPTPVPLDCAPGCDACCRNFISVTPLEALALGRFLEEGLAPAARREFQGRVLRMLPRIRGLSTERLYAIRRDHPCPFLVEGECGVYEARPLACRGWHSINREQCKAAMFSDDPAAGVESFESRRRISESLQLGLLAAGRELGLESGSVLMVRAAALALQDGAEAMARSWLAGSPFLARAARL